MMRTAAAKVKPRVSKEATFPFPIGGWIKNVNLAAPDARRPDGSKVNGAAVLENIFPTATGGRVRGGSEIYTTVEDQTDITALFAYMNGNNRSMFAATGTAIYDITASSANFLVDDASNNLVDEDGNFLIEGSVNAAVGSLTGGNWISVQFATSGGVFLRLVNGVDTPRVYDGTTFSTTPAITGTGLDPADLSHVWQHARRLWFVERDSLNAWYLDVDLIGGTATVFPLGGVFTRGGSLLFGASWSLDTGSGLTDACAFFSSEGEVAIYQGSNPASAATWSLVGVYRIGKPRGPKALIKAGGDLVIATDIGFIPLSVAISRDVAALSPSAISYPIETAWNDAVDERSLEDWHCEIWPTKQMVVVALPTPDGTAPQMFVANARTGAWALYTGWDGKCLLEFNGRLFFGSTNGAVLEAEVTGKDRDQTYVAVCVPLFDTLKSSGDLKVGELARYTIRAPSPVEVRLSLQVDYDINLPSPPDDITVPSGSVWGSGIWGTSTWSSPSPRRTFREWQSISGAGYAVAVALQITSGSASPPDVELVQVEATFDQGDILS